VESRDRLFRCSNEILVLTIARDLVTRWGGGLNETSTYELWPDLKAINYLVKLFVEIRELSSLCHNILVHEERGLKLLVGPLAKEGETIVDQSEVEIDTSFSQEITTVTSDVGTTLLIVTI
jgi:hypothetical protein